MQIGFSGLDIDGTGTSTAEYSMSGGTLSISRFFTLGNSGTGRFRQTSGDVTIGALPSDRAEMGLSPGSRGIYELSGGTVTINGELRMGRDGAGEFIQDAGDTRVTGALVLADGRGTDTRYDLRGGELMTTVTEVGLTNRAQFIHTGGQHIAEQLNIGTFTFPASDPPLAASYHLSGDATLEAAYIDIGRGPIGELIQSSGAVVASGGIRIAVSGDAQTESRYHLQGGTLTDGGMEIGIYGNGRFLQTGGQHEVNGTLRISGGTGCQCSFQSRYNLEAGELAVHGPMHVGKTSNHPGQFVQRGGVATMDNNVILGTDGGIGTLRVEAGQLSIGGNLLLGESGSISQGIVEVVGGQGTVTIGGDWLTRVAPDPNYRPRVDVLIDASGLTTLAVAGRANLGGDLYVDVADATLLIPGTPYVVLTADGGISGGLSLTGPDRDRFVLEASQGAVTLTVLVPEPCGKWLAGLVIVLAIGSRRFTPAHCRSCPDTKDFS
jgi:hypothetical protein